MTNLLSSLAAMPALPDDALLRSGVFYSDVPAKIGTTQAQQNQQHEPKGHSNGLGRYGC
jgi:hypothetical protein